MRKLWIMVLLILLNEICGLSFQQNELRYVGRYDLSRDYPSADWSGSGITMFVNTSHLAGSDGERVHMSLIASIGAVSGSESVLFFVGVLVNCELLGIYEVSSENNIIEFSYISSSNFRLDEIHIMKLTEGSYSENQGELALSGYELSPKSTLVIQDLALNFPPTCRSSGRLSLLIIGDSITAAYGVDGVDPCTYSASTQNFLHSYAYLTAQALGAELTTLAWSGKGVVRNYGDDNPTSENPMPVYYNRTLAPLSTSDAPTNFWSPDRYTPDVVLVMLGSNDYSTYPNPSDEDFTGGLADFLSRIKTDYPNALIGAMCAPSNHGNQCINIEKATVMTNSYYVGMNSSLYVYPNGCDGHPSVATQQNIADVVVPAVRQMLNERSLL